MAKFIRIVHWRNFQHYKDRNPPWIKLHQELLTSQTWVTGDDATRSLAIACMLLASRTDNKIPLDPAYIQRVGYLHRKPDLSQLLATQFIEIVDEAGAASGMQATASRSHANARPEAEAETETEKNRAEKTRASLTLKRATRIPEDFHPSEKHRELAKDLGLDVKAECEMFSDHFRAKSGSGATKYDWSCAFNNWLKRAHDWKKGHKNGNSNGNSETIRAAADRIAARDIA